MANKLMLESRTFSSSYNLNNQFALTKFKSIQLLRFKTRPYGRDTVLRYNLCQFKHEFDNNTERVKTPKIQTRPILDLLSSSIDSLKKPVIAVVLTCVLMIIHCSHRYPAWAASGGCMGGDSGFDSSSSSYSSGSSSYDSCTSFGCTGGDSGSSESSSEDDSYNLRVFGWFCFAVGLMIAIAQILIYFDERNTKCSIVKLQVGLSGITRPLQRELNKIALAADTSNIKGINYVLTETIRALLQHPDHFTSAFTLVNTESGIKNGEKRYRELSMEERAKFDEETLFNVNNIRKLVKRSTKDTGISSEFIVITNLVAVRGVVELPTINRSADLKKALQKLRSISSDQTIAARVLWTPQEENDTLSEEELRKDYPLLKPLE